MKKNPKYPRHLSSITVDFLKSLLDKNPESRLGCSHQFEEIKRHQFFHGVDWKSYESKDFKEHSILKLDLRRCYFDSEYVG